MTTRDYKYRVINGPGLLDLAYGQYRGKTLVFTVQKNFGDHACEMWVVSVDATSCGNDDLRADEIFKLSGMVISSGPDFHNQTNLNGTTNYVFGHYNARNRTCHDAVATVYVD